MACVLIDTRQRVILDWRKDALPDASAASVCAYIRQLGLQPYGNLTVLIENQPAIYLPPSRSWRVNPKLLRVEGQMAAGLTMLGATVHVQASSVKSAYLRRCAGLLKRQYKDHKSMSIAVGRELILPNHDSPAALSLRAAFEDASYKKDDVADALVQAGTHPPLWFLSCLHDAWAWPLTGTACALPQALAFMQLSPSEFVQLAVPAPVPARGPARPPARGPAPGSPMAIDLSADDVICLD